MTGHVDYDAEVNAYVAQCDAKIQKLKDWATEAPPELQAKINRDISELIANREAVRRGLLPVTESGEVLCPSCSEQDPQSMGGVH